MNNKYFLAIFSLLVCFLLIGCSLVNTDTSSDGEASDTSTNIGTDTEADTSGDTGASGETDKPSGDTGASGETDKPSGEENEYFVAQVNVGSYVTAEPYVGNATVSEELVGLYYSASEPGGAPKNDGTGKIWLTLKTYPSYVINVRVTGEYSSVENISGDIYCVHDVKSDLEISVSISTLQRSEDKLFEDYGYSISENGILTVNWVESPSEPLRYVEIAYGEKNTKKTTEYIDASLGSTELLQMTENKIYSISVRAIGKTCGGKSFEFDCSYMTAPKSVNFPRVEITTDGFVWPSFDQATGKPSGCWGAGIANAEYENCSITIYNESNEVIYSSLVNDEEFLGARLKVRGNTSAVYASNQRYPYKIKLDEKADLLSGLTQREDKDGYSDKNWLLLNYGNYEYRTVGDAIADAVGTEWSPDCAYVGLYINGDYRGLYILSESVKEGNGEGEEQARVPVDGSGYVFECDAYWWNEEFSFSTPLTENTPMHFTLKYPDADTLTTDSVQIEYLRDYLTCFEEALMRDDESYLEYIDLDSFVKWLLVSDYLCINDGGGCNLFLYKENSTDETKIHMGPNWDFDSYKGSVDGLAVIRLSWDTAPFYYQYLIKKPSFDARYRELFASTHIKLEEYINDAFEKIDIEAHYRLVELDNRRFGTSLKTLTSRKDAFLKWLDDHIDWMKTKFE